jgi:dolichol-phosphate mannosyltransferase
MNNRYAVIIPMANEASDFHPFILALTEMLKINTGGTVYFIVDNASKDLTLELCNSQSLKDDRFKTIWAPENKNVVDAYIIGYKEALLGKHDYVIEMDAGLSHDPKEVSEFLKALENGYDCAFGSRFIEGGSIKDSSWKRTFLSKTGTILSNLLLGTKMNDMTSGYQGFKVSIVEKFCQYNLLSKAHFYQTELRYLLRKTHFVEIPINYRAPSPRVSQKAILNSISVLLHYFALRLKFRSPVVK